VHFTGKNYVLPRTGQEGIPVVSVRIKQYIETDRKKIWSGTLDVDPELNAEVTTAFPVMEAAGQLDPGVYVMAARPAGDGLAASDYDDDSSGTATQWFIVSDLGLTALTGKDGIHAFLRSLASAGPLAGVEVRLMASDFDLEADGRGRSHSFRSGFCARRGRRGTEPARRRERQG
jgi:uncharacterized protein YfaS (alpha-2-macroglobulin family)